MRFLRRVSAEAMLVSPRLTRTRLGPSLLLLGAGLAWLRSRGLDPLTAVLEAGALAAVLGAGWLAGNARDRAALATALTHPTTPLAIATGRWSAIVLPAVLLVIACAVASGAPATTAAAGMVAACAVAAVALGIVLLLGNSAAVAFFLLIAVAGGIAPEQLVGLTHPGIARLAAASILELGPALWRYRDNATGDWLSLCHALAWTGVGILCASGIVARQRASLH
jgi:hypothetical protein